MKIFMLVSRVPFPLIKGDKLRAFNQLKELSKHHEVFLCALSDDRPSAKDIDQLQPYCSRIEVIHLSKINILFQLITFLLWTNKPLQVGYFFQRRAKKRIQRFIQEFKPDHLYCQLIRTAEYLKNQPIPKTLDYMDSLSSGMQRRMEKAPFYYRRILQLETKRLKRYEHDIFTSFDHATIISERDRKFIVNYDNEQITVIENGVDQHYFHPENSTKSYDLLFTGNMSYAPNVESVRYLIKEIMPLVWTLRPQTKLLVAGANPSRKLREMANDNVIFSGWVNDIRHYYNESRIFIAPMRIGSGLQNKLLEAMSMNLPCITSDLANNSLNAPEGSAIMIGKSTEAYAEIIIDLLDHPDRAKQLAHAGREFVREHFNWEKSVRKLDQVFTSSNEKL